MEHIQDIYKEKPELIENLLKNHVSKINLKVDGKPFQVLYNEETDELEFHGRSGNETTVGPLITDIDRYFSKFVNDAIRHIEDRADLFKKYKFMTIEIIDNELLLTSIITKSGEFVNSPKEIRKIADELETEVMPTLWEGQLSDAQIKVLMEIIKSGEVPTKGDFIKVVKALFDKDPNFPKKLIMANTEFIEGIVFFFDVKGKIVEYKLVDPAFRAQSAGYKASSKEEKDKNKETYNKLYEFYLDWVEKNGEKLADNRIHSIELNFIKMMKDPKIYNKVMNMASGIRINNIARYGVQLDRTTPEMAKEIRKNGDVYKTLYEIFFNMFKKPKKRNYTINKEFQMKVNDAIALFEGMEGYEHYANDLIEEEFDNDDFILEANEAKNEGWSKTNDTFEKYAHIWCKTSKDFMDMCERYGNGQIKKLLNNNKEAFKDVIKSAYKTAGKNLTYKNVPLFIRKSSKNVKSIAPSSFAIKRNFKDRLQLQQDLHEKFGIDAEFHNGFGESKGLKFENDLNVALFRYMLNNCSTENLNIEDKSVEMCLKNLENGNSENGYQFGELNEILKKVSNHINKKIGPDSKLAEMSDVEIAKHLKEQAEDYAIKQTGGSNTKRGISNIFAELELSENNKDKKLTESGEIISDITLTDGNDKHFLSVKEEEAQLSGVVVSPSENGVRWIDQYLGSDEVEDNINKQAIEFFSTFGIDEEQLKQIKNHYKGEKNKKLVLKPSNVDGKKIGNIISRLIGGNYWYISPKKCFYVSDDARDFDWKYKKGEENCYLSESGKTLVMKGQIDDISLDIILRTSSDKHVFPTRLFPKISGKELINLIRLKSS